MTTSKFLRTAARLVCLLALWLGGVSGSARAADTTAPSVPTAISFSNETGGSVTVSWTASTDDVAVTGYEVFYNDISAGTVGAVTSMSVKGLVPSTVYQITVRARDAAANWSAKSGSKAFRTWDRLYVSSGDIYINEYWDEENMEYYYVPSEASHGSFYVPVAGTLKVYTLGPTDTEGDLLGSSPVYAVESGGFGDNFLISQSVSASWCEITVRGDQQEEDIGYYQIYADFKPTANTSPVAQITAAPKAGNTPLVVSLSGSASYDPNGTIALYSWDLNLDSVEDAAGRNLVHSFTHSGSSPTMPVWYFPTLKVTDQLGATTTTSVTVDVYYYNATTVTVINGTSSAGSGTYPAGTLLGISAMAPPAGMQFGSWSANSGIWNVNASNTLFNGSGAQVLQANFVPDVTAPTVPTGMTVANGTGDTATLSWTASTDAAGAPQYEVFRNGVSLGFTTSTSMALTGLSHSTIYQFTVRAGDVAGNRSALSESATLRKWQQILNGSGTITWEYVYDEGLDDWYYQTSIDYHTLPIPQSGMVRVNSTGGWDIDGRILQSGMPLTGWMGGSSDFSFQQSVTVGGLSYLDLEVKGGSYAGDFNYGVKGYFLPGGNPLADIAATPIVGRAPLAVTFHGGGSADGDGMITAYAWDFENNGSTDATTQSASTSYANAGSSAITYTAKLTVTGPSGNANTTRTITVYPASMYAISVVNGTTSLPYQAASSTVSLTAVAPPGGGTFTGWVLVSGAGTFTSASSSSTTFTMGSADTVVRATYGTDSTAPSTPTGLTYAERTAKTITLIWNATSDNVGVVGYIVYRGGVQIGTTGDVVFADSGLTASTSYAYTVKAMDAAGNLSSASSTANISTTADFTLDTDQDGIPNAAETALGTNTSAAAAADASNVTQLKIHRPLP